MRPDLFEDISADVGEILIYQRRMFEQLDHRLRSQTSDPKLKAAITRLVTEAKRHYKRGLEHGTFERGANEVITWLEALSSEQRQAVANLWSKEGLHWYARVHDTDYSIWVAHDPECWTEYQQGRASKMGTYGGKAPDAPRSAKLEDLSLFVKFTLEAKGANLHYDQKANDIVMRIFAVDLKIRLPNLQPA